VILDISEAAVQRVPQMLRSGGHDTTVAVETRPQTVMSQT
jgi:hypothetical protein